jgi:hypothetical protein
VRIAVFGATGTIGRRVVAEAKARGHTVTLVMRDPSRLPPGVVGQLGDARDPASVMRAVRGCDAVVSAVGPHASDPPTIVVEAARGLVAGLAQAGVRRLIVVGGAGSLEVSPGVQLADTPDFPAAWRPVALAHREALEVYRSADLDWTYVSPAAFLEPGTRTGSYRVGFDQLLTDAQGESRISVEDYAVALVDELERPTHLRRRITVAT